MLERLRGRRYALARTWPPFGKFPVRKHRSAYHERLPARIDPAGSVESVGKLFKSSRHWLPPPAARSNL